MKHYVLGLVFSQTRNNILLVKKEKPKWMKDRWNGIGGKIKNNETPPQAMDREAMEETGYNYTFEHVITFVCPGGTVYVFKTICSSIINYKQVESEELRVCDMYNLPTTMMANLKWIIPLSLSCVQFPVIIQQTKLGIH